jgi:flavin reductase (DIM6/NTAB) family NADH-FMN oxidoreductase RutF
VEAVRLEKNPADKEMVMNLDAFYKINSGLYVVSSGAGECFNGQITNAVIQVAAEPPKLAISINKKNLTHQLIENSRVFAVAVLSRDTPLKFIGRFGFKSGRDINKCENVAYCKGTTGTHVITENMVACFEAEVSGHLDMDTHTLFVGRVIEAEILKDEEPMTYAYYRDVKRGTAPETAPTWHKPR